MFISPVVPEVKGQEPEVRSQGSRNRGQCSQTTAMVEKERAQSCEAWFRPEVRGQSSESRVRPEARGQGSNRGQGSKPKGHGQRFKGRGHWPGIQTSGLLSPGGGLCLYGLCFQAFCF